MNGGESRGIKIDGAAIAGELKVLGDCLEWRLFMMFLREISAGNFCGELLRIMTALRSPAWV
jgi:hypothetical protein